MQCCERRVLEGRIEMECMPLLTLLLLLLWVILLVDRLLLLLLQG